MRQNNLTPAERADLVDSVRDMAWHLAWKIVAARIGREHLDDGFQECMLAAAKSAQVFDPATGFKFSNFAFPAMNWAADWFVRRERSAGRIEAAGAMGEVGCADEPDLDSREELEKLDRGLSILPAGCRAVIEARYGLTGESPLSQKQCAAVVGVHRNSVQRMEKEAMRRLRNHMGAEREQAKRRRRYRVRTGGGPEVGEPACAGVGI